MEPENIRPEAPAFDVILSSALIVIPVQQMCLGDRKTVQGSPKDCDRVHYGSAVMKYSAWNWRLAYG